MDKSQGHRVIGEVNRLGLFIFSVGMAAHCASYGIEDLPSYEYEKLRQQSALNSTRLSQSTFRYLRMNNLWDEFDSNGLVTIYKLDHQLVYQKERQFAFYLSEMCFAFAQKESDTQLRKRLFASSVVYAYTFLFDTKMGALPSEFEQNFANAIELYNRSLAELMNEAISERLVFSEGELRFPLIRGTLITRKISTSLPWKPLSFLDIRTASAYRPLGFSNKQDGPGLGVPLILIRHFPNQSNTVLRDRFEYFAGVEQAYPATSLFVLEESYTENDDLNLVATFQLLDPLVQTSLTIHTKQIPIDYDLTTPMAYMLAKAEKEDGFLKHLSGKAISQKKGLSMLYPYDKNKIPVIFVHGLASSPFIWFQTINELLGDPEIRKRYQFWVYWYPTTDPVNVSAADFRETLYQVRNTFDAKSENPNFNKTIIIGHSMGGLLAKLTAQKSSSEDWMRELKLDPEKLLSLPDENRLQIERLISYEPVPFVNKLIFVATPHKGSPLADGFLGAAGRSVIRLPTNAFSQFVKFYSFVFSSEADPSDLSPDSSGIDSLSPKSLFMRVTNQQAIVSSVKYYSIIGNSQSVFFDWITDGVVSYESAHLEGAQSELLVESGHSVHEHVPTILEIRRILLLPN